MFRFLVYHLTDASPSEVFSSQKFFCILLIKFLISAKTKNSWNLSLIGCFVRMIEILWRLMVVQYLLGFWQRCCFPFKVHLDDGTLFPDFDSIFLNCFLSKNKTFLVQERFHAIYFSIVELFVSDLMFSALSLRSVMLFWAFLSSSFSDLCAAVNSSSLINFCHSWYSYICRGLS